LFKKYVGIGILDNGFAKTYRGLGMEWKYMELLGIRPAYRKHGQILTFAVEDDAVG